MLCTTMCHYTSCCVDLFTLMHLKLFHFFLFNISLLAKKDIFYIVIILVGLALSSPFVTLGFNTLNTTMPPQSHASLFSNLFEICYFLCLSAQTRNWGNVPSGGDFKSLQARDLASISAVPS